MRIRRVVKRCTAAILMAVMLTLGVGISVLDAETEPSGPHVEAQSDSACPGLQHNHSLCEFLAATPLLGTAGGFPELARAREVALNVQSADAVLASVTILRPNSRSPPID